MLTFNLKQLVLRRFHVKSFYVVVFFQTPIKDLDTKLIKFTTHNVVTTAETHLSHNNNNTQMWLS